jgi:signal transduction histidine kinase
VAERPGQLKGANEALEAFSYSVSHDLRAPLRALDGFSQVLLEQHAGELGPEGKRLLGRVRDAATRMGRLIDDLLRFSRAGAQQLRPERVDMTELARSAWDELAASDQGPPVVFQLDRLPEAVADPALLRQVWLNLLSNALKFTSKRTGRTVRVRGRTEGGRSVYEVEDDGVGFEMAGASRLFAVFERLRGAGEFEGTGVGLSLVKRIVERHGGDVSARGEVGLGATVSFALPADPPARPDRPALRGEAPDG